MRHNRQKGEGIYHVLNKLENRIKEGDYYGALQMYKTLYSRYYNNNDTKNAIEIAYKGSITLATYKQSTAAMEMGLLMLDVFINKKFQINSENKEKIEAINKAFLENELIHTTDLAKFLQAAVKWSASEGNRARGDIELNYLTAQAFEKSNEHFSASKYYLYCEKPKEHCAMLLNWIKKGYASEKDLFLARVVLQYLCLENLRDANIIFENFLQEEKIDTPLIHYLKFLLKTLERDAAPLFLLLKEKYSISLARDESFSSYISIIGQKFYRIQPPQSGLGALMNMFGVL